MHILKSLTVIFLLSLPLLSSPVNAAGYKSNCCTAPLVDQKCAQLKIEDPTVVCDVYYCEVDESGICTGSEWARIPPPAGADPETELIDVNFFGITLRLDSSRAISELIFLLFSLFLAVVALAAVGIGIFAAIQRAVAETDDKIAQTTSAMRNALVGFVIIILSLLIAQLVASLLGIRSIVEISQVDSLLPSEQVQDE